MEHQKIKKFLEDIEYLHDWEILEKSDMIYIKFAIPTPESDNEKTSTSYQSILDNIENISKRAEDVKIRITSFKVQPLIIEFTADYDKI